MKHDLIIRNANIVDGTGSTPYIGDIAIENDSIVALGKVDAEGIEEIDADGNEVWQRTDSFYLPDDNEGAESASEFVIKTAAGNYASVVDQGFGIGLMLLNEK